MPELHPPLSKIFFLKTERIDINKLINIYFQNSKLHTCMGIA